MCMCEQLRLHCTSQWGWWIMLSEHVYCVVIAFNMAERVEQRICIKFSIRLDYSSAETMHLWAIGDWQLHHNNAPAHTLPLRQRFLENHQITQVTQPSYSPDLAPGNFWLFPKLKSPLKGKRFQTIDEIQENTMG